MGSGTIPSTLGELELTFLDRHPSAICYFSHNLGLLLADLLLFAADGSRFSANAIGIHD